MWFARRSLREPPDLSPCTAQSWLRGGRRTVALGLRRDRELAINALGARPRRVALAAGPSSAAGGAAAGAGVCADGSFARFPAQRHRDAEWLCLFRDDDLAIRAFSAQGRWSGAPATRVLARRDQADAGAHP